MATVEPPEILQGEQPRMTYQEWYKGKDNHKCYIVKSVNNTPTYKQTAVIAPTAVLIFFRKLI